MSSMPSSWASSMTTSVLLAWPGNCASRSANWLRVSATMVSVIIERSRPMSERSQASCKVMKLRLAASTKPATSKSAGMPQPCAPPCTPRRPAPIMEPVSAGAVLSKWVDWLSQGRAEASLPTFSGLYCLKDAGWSAVAPAPWYAIWGAAGARRRMTMPMTAMTTMASSITISTLPKASPKPSEWASQARPRPAARPPSMAPQGFLGAACAGAVADLGVVAGAACCVGATGACGRTASRWVTLPDCWPTDLPPPRRRAASALRLPRARTPASMRVRNLFTLSPKKSKPASVLSTFDTDMQGYHPCAEVVKIHMPKSGFFHAGFQLLLPGMHADRLGQVAVAVGITGYQFAHVRQDVEAVPVVDFFQRLGHFGEFEHQQLAARLKHAAHLGQGHILVCHVAQAKGHTDQVEVLVRKRKFFGIAHQRG